MKNCSIHSIFVAVVMVICIPVHALPLEKLSLPEGFKIEIFAAEVNNARQMALGDKGTIFVGSRSPGLVHAVVDTNSDGTGDKVIEIASGLTMPSGLAFKDGTLYVAAVDKVFAYENIEQRLDNPPEGKVVIDDLPSELHHGWKYIDFGPDGHLYIPVGTPCNVCLTKGDKKFNQEIFDSIVKYDLATGKRQFVARGVRNSVGFDWHPETQELWFSDNGRDWLGDNLPPCEINRVSREGQHFGYPFFHGGLVADPEFGQDKHAKDYEHPVLNLGAHVAPLGIHFYQGNMFPQQYKKTLLVAEHGSWNRTKKVGYKIMIGTVEGNELKDYKPFIEGWLEDNEQVWGRPVAFLAMPDGSILISDDFANVIYRVSFQS